MNLSSLPADVIRCIYDLEETSADRLRLISPRWNVVVSECANDPRNGRPLERLYFYNGPPDAECADYDEQDADSRWLNEQAHELVQMYAVVADESSDNIGICKWLTVRETFDDNALEVYCDPQKVATGPTPKSLIKLILLFFIFLLTIVAHVFGVSLVRAKTKYRRARMARFVSMFSHIDMLALEGFGNRRVLDSAISTLGDITIDKLDVRMHNFDEGMQNRIIELVRKHAIKEVCIVIVKCDLRNLEKFLIGLTNLDATVNMYEAVGTTNRKPNLFNGVSKCFHRSFLFWAEMKSRLDERGVSIELLSKRDGCFNCGQFHLCFCGSVIFRAKLACKPVAYDDFQDDGPRPRGYYHYRRN